MEHLRKLTTNFYMKQGVCALLGSVYSSNHVCNTDLCFHISKRTFLMTSRLTNRRNFYDDLEIPRTATQSEIKNAYYNLSKVFHPDKNKGCENASKRFREITAAYEVLGNFRTRRMYDKGIGSFGISTQSPGTESEIINEPVEDDAQTKFYKQHMVRSQVPDMADRVSARDLDAWASQKTSECFHQQQYIKTIRRQRREDNEDAKIRGKSVGYVGVLLFIFFAYVTWQERNRTVHYSPVINEKKITR